jgi:outer membrane protein assembly factor BamB
VKDLGDNIEASAAVDNNTDSSFYGRVYVGKDDDDEGVGRVFAFDPNSIPPETPKWSFQTVEDIQSTPAISKDGSVVYAVDDTGLVYAINNSTDIAIDGTEKWSEPTDLNKTVDYISPAVDTSDSSAAGTIYVATNDGNLFAIDPDGTKKPAPWPIFLGSTITYSSPAVGPDGVIYIGTDDGFVHAVKPDGSVKWEYLTDGAVQSSPEIDDDGVVYIGSDDNKVYAIATAALPRNFRNDHPDFHEVPVDFRSVSFYPISQKAHITDDDIEAGADIDSENDWLNGGSLLLPWAVRIEVEKIAAQTYELKTWIRQCTIGDCSDIKNTLFQDTERKYDYSPLIYPGSVPPIKRQPLVQTITLTAAEDEQFERVLFGFTTAAKSGDSQLITVRDFQLTFIEAAREDVAVFDDPNWP